MKRSVAVFMIIFLLSGTTPSRAELVKNDVKNTAIVRSIGRELRQVLSPDEQRLFPSRCVVVVKDPEPWIKPVIIDEGIVAGRYVAISSGMIREVSMLARAEATDRFAPGYLEKYLNRSASGNKTPPAGVSTIEFTNEQESNFNQLIAMAIAMHFSHHRLGHFDKFGPDLEQPGAAMPINILLHPTEWNDAFKTALENSLAAGYSTEGFARLCRAIEELNVHPDWTIFFVPETFDAERLIEQMEETQQEFFQSLGE